MQIKYDEMYELYYDTEQVVNKKMSAVQHALSIKDQEVIKLKQILYEKEDMIRKVSIAYEQYKSNIETYEDEITYLKTENMRLLNNIALIQKHDKNNLFFQVQNLKLQNKQLLQALMNHLTKTSRKSK
jgi:hypothetical protein